MNDNASFLENMDMLDPDFPLILHYDRLSAGNFFFSHWHDPIELLYIVRGSGVIVCNTCPTPVKPGNLIVVNSNELHKGYSTSDSLEYYCIIAGRSLFSCRKGNTAEIGCLSPVYSNNILFQNKIEKDNIISECIEGIVREYNGGEAGFELSIKSHLYRLMVLLMRKYARQVMTPNEYDMRSRNLVRLNGVIQYIEDHYSESITIDLLSSMTNLSRFYLCHLFKEITGKSIGSHINQVRINNSERLLKGSGMNVTEVAMACGFSDANYYSRLFRKLKSKSPMQVKKESTYK